MDIKLHPKAEEDLYEALNHYSKIDTNLYQYENIIMVLAIFHASRNPRSLQNRTSKNKDNG